MKPTSFQWMLSLTFVFLLTSILLPAQKTELDSLQNLLPNLPHDTNRVKVLNRVAKLVRGADPEASMQYGKEALSILKSISYPIGKIDANYEIGAAHIYFPEKARAGILYLEASILEAEKAGRPELMSRGYTAIGNFAIPLFEKLEALEKAMQYAKQANDKKRVVRATFALALAHGQNNNYEESIRLYHLAIEEAEAIDYQGVLPKLYSNVGAMYSFFEEQDKLEAAANYTQKALVLTDKNENPVGWAGYAINMARINGLLEKYDEAFVLINEADPILKEENQHNYMSLVGISGELYMRMNQPRKAIPLLLESLEYSAKYKADFRLEADLRFLAEAYAQNRDFENAYFYADSVRRFVKSTYLEDAANKLTVANAKFQAAEREAQIARQELEISQQKTAQNRTLFGGIIALLLATGAYFYFSQKQKRKKEAAEARAATLEELDTLKSGFFTNISHELRTPLTLIAGPLENALEKVKIPSLKKDLRLAHSNSKKLLALVNEILDLSKMEAGKLTLHESSVQLDSTLRRLFFSFKSLAEMREVKLVFHNEVEENEFIKTDAEKLEKIVNNLLSNALKFSKSGGEVILRAKKENGQLRLTVSDRGEGIPPDVLPKVFDRFFQAGENPQGGSGVGLALSRELARLMKGDLTVESQYGKGSDFSVWLPFVPAVVTPGSEEKKMTEQTKFAPTIYSPLLFKGKKPQLLIVEDNPEMSQYLIGLLSPQYDCATAANGKQAFEIMQKNNFDLITCDVMMPEMDGFELRQKLNEQDGLPHIPFVFVTARAVAEDKIRGLRLGVDDYIAKPFEKAELLARIHNLLQNKIEREQWEESYRPEKEDVPESAEVKLLKEAERVVTDNLENSDFKVSDLARELGHNQRSLGRIIKKMTGLSSVNFILEIRLQKARELLEQRRFLSVSEVRYAIGIESASYFSTKFTERFGRSPKEYLDGNS